MPKILYQQVIEEDPRKLEKLEKRHRYTHLFQRLQTLWATLGANARGGSQATGEAVWKSCSKAG
jgi:hypothetical protein